MAVSPPLWVPNNFRVFSHSPYPLSSFPFPILQTRRKSLANFKLNTSCHQIIETEDPKPRQTPKKKQKLKPSFYDQVQEKWSLKTPSQRLKFPWQEEEEEEEEEEKEEQQEHENFKNSGDGVVSPPWTQRIEFDFSSESVCLEKTRGFKDTSKKDGIFKGNEGTNGFPESGLVKPLSSSPPWVRKKKPHFSLEVEPVENTNTRGPKEMIEEEESFEEEQRIEENLESGFGENVASFLGSSLESNSIEAPWDRTSVDGDKGRRNNTQVAEKTIPEAELRRLRNVSLRMFERIKVKTGGITQALIDKIHEKWERDEVVKIRFEGPPAHNMKRTHETLESRSGGLVIWRSGSSLVLYRGMAYKLSCVKSYTKLSQANMSTTSPLKDSTSNVRNTRENDSDGSKSVKSSKNRSKELMDIDDLNDLLDELGPRFKDWSGCEPQPVDADLLPGFVPGYAPPFRLLPHGIKQSLGNKEMTTYRRLARISPPHFALGRNRDLQGLAMAMVKLWQRNAIAKIAIKRGVQNTHNERMAEELKKLTGGTLLSRNIDYIVFYRGNDFLSPSVTVALLEREKLAELQHDKEEQARDRASILFISNAQASKSPYVAGTLAETIAANSRWGTQKSNKDVEKMKRDLAVTKHASLVRYLEKKLVSAQDKVNKAEKDLRKIQGSLNPADLPSDLETISDEERFLFRRMGLSMKPFLLVGRSGVFGGTVENMHLHWKHRELVKIIVKGKNFPQVKHIAISLEAESGGLLISVDKTTKGYEIIIYRGKNYQRPFAIRPQNLLTKRQALARSIVLQRREGLIHHISDLREQISLLKRELDDMEAVKEAADEAG